MLLMKTLLNQLCNMNALEITDKLKTYIENKINILSKSNPILNFSQPFIMKIIDNKSAKISSFLNLFADDNGNIDIESLIDDMIQRLNTVDPFNLPLGSFNGIVIGGGKIKVGIPFIDKAIVFNVQDITALKSMLQTKISPSEE